MVLNGEQSTASGLGTFDQQVFVDRLQSEGVDHANVDTFLGQCIGGDNSLVKSDTGTHHCHLVTVTRADNLDKTVTTGSL